MNNSGIWVPFSGRKVMNCPHCNRTITTLKVTIQKPKLLIVEGVDEEELFCALMQKLNIDDIQVVGIGGKNSIGPNLKALVKDRDFSKVLALGVIRDADTDPPGAFRSVKDALTAAGMPTPKRPMHFVKGPPRVGVMIIPAITRKGEIEDLCLEAIANDPAMTCVEQYFECLKQEGLNQPMKLSKAKVRVFLSSREDPTLPLGISARRGYWPLESEAFRAVQEFLQSL